MMKQRSSLALSVRMLVGLLIVMTARHAGGVAARPGAEEDAPALSAFAENALLHVVLHEVGHALVREFDLPILGNEETLADAFATHYLVTHLPDRAPDVLEARIRWWMAESADVPRDEWDVSGEHNSDARRAHQVAALAIAADPQRYAFLGKLLEMSDDDMQAAADYGAEIHRSWRRILQPLWMPDGVDSSEVRVTFDPTDSTIQQVQASDLPAALEAALRRFDWHSQITLSFTQGDGGANWQRASRSIRVDSSFVARVIRRGEELTTGEQPDDGD